MNQTPTSTPYPGPSFPGFPTLDVEGLIKAIVKRAWIIGTTFGACIAAALVYVFLFAPTLYESTAVIYVEPERERILDENIRRVRTEDFQKLDALKSLEQNIVSGTVILRVIEKYGLADDPDFLKPKGNGESYSDAEIVEEVSSNVEATLRRGTRLIEIAVRDTSPERAEMLARAFVEEFEALLIKQKLDSSRKARETLREEADSQLKRVNAAEDTLQAFREKHSGAPLEEGGIIEQKLNDLDKLLSTVKNEKLRLQSEFEQIEMLEGEDPERILEIGNYVDLEHIGKLLLARNQKRAEFAKIRRQFQPTHQTYIAYQSEIQGFDEQVRSVAIAVGESIRKRYHSAVEHEAKLRKSVEDQKQVVLSVDRVRKEFRSLKHVVDAAYETHNKLLARINETDVSEGVKESHIRLSEEPLVPSKPSSPKKKLIVGGAGFFGAVLGTGIVLLIYLLDRSLRTRRQVEQSLGLPVLGEIPMTSNNANAVPADALVVAREPHSLAAESFRSLRLSLASLSPRSVMVTSAMPGDGKSFCAANLALLQAQLGYRTLVVDADFRKPSMAQLLMPAVSENHSLEPQNICQKTAFPNLFLLSCSRYAPNAGGAMNGEHFAAMLWEAYRNFDCIIVDSSPLGIVSDALNFARYVDAVTLVVRSGVTHTADAQRACQELRRLRAPLAGSVLNGSTHPSRAKEAYYQSYAPVPRRQTLALQTSQA